MAAPVTRIALCTRARSLANQQSLALVDDTELQDMVNIVLAELYDEVVDLSPPDYYSLDASPISVVAGTVGYALPDDFRSAIMVSVQTGSTVNDLQPIPQVRDGQRGRLRAPTAAAKVLLRYVPAPPVLTTDDDPVTGSFDGISGWDDLIVQLLVRRVKAKESPQTMMPAVETAIAELRARIRSQVGKRNLGGIDYVTEVEDYDTCWPLSGTTLLAGYQIRAGKLDLYETRNYWP